MVAGWWMVGGKKPSENQRLHSNEDREKVTTLSLTLMKPVLLSLIGLSSKRVIDCQ